MASSNLYPPIVNNVEPAFLVYPKSVAVNDRGTLRINFYMSALSSKIDLENLSVHVKIFNSKNVKVLNTADGGKGDGTPDNFYRLRGAGMILNLTPQYDRENNVYYVDIKAEDISYTSSVGSDTYLNWTPGWTYKVQIRLSSEFCPIDSEADESDKGQEAWLFQYQDHFSEWSQVIYAKAIPEMKVSINGFDAKNPSGDPIYSIPPGYTGTWTIPEWTRGVPSIISGSIGPGIINDGVNEYYKSYRIIINKIDNSSIVAVDGKFDYQTLAISVYEDSGDLFAQEDSYTKIEYRLKRKFRIVETCYNLHIVYETLNGYQGEKDYFFKCTNEMKNNGNIRVYTADTLDAVSNPHSVYQTTPLLKKNDSKEGILSHNHSNNDPNFSVGMDEEEGRVSLKLFASNTDYSEDTRGIYYRIVRASMEDGFANWIPIHYGYIPPISDISTCDEFKEIKYDYTIESGVLYQYGIECLDTTSSIETIEEAYYPAKDEKYVCRIFDHSYFLEENNKQLKITFDPNISTFSNRVNDFKIETVGGKFPFISRNAAVQYRTFAITGTIASDMDDHELFFNQDNYYNKKYFGDDSTLYLADKYREIASERGLYHRNFILEKDFRNEVLKFLGNGKPKLFKSATEGNIIVRLTDVSITPNQTLSRLICSFSATVDEIDDATMENYLKYGFYNPGSVQNITINYSN